MREYVVRRLLFVAPTLLAVYTITFLIMHATPGGPWDHGEKPLPPQALANLNARYHLDAPLWKQYVSYLGNALRGDLGPSYADRSRDVGEIIGDFLPVSIQLGAVAAILGLTVGIPLGVIAAVKQNTWVDYLATLVSVAGGATPSYVMVTLLIFVLALTLHLVPTGGWDGISSPRIIIPVTGSFFVETVSGVPGVGRYFVTAASGRDYPVLMALTLLYAGLIIMANLAVDVGYGLLDPRISYT